MNRRQDFAEELVDSFGAADHEHMVAFSNDVARGCQTNGEDFVAGAMDVIKRLGNGAIIPIQHGVEGPADETVVTGEDHLSHEPPDEIDFHDGKLGKLNFSESPGKGV